MTPRRLPDLTPDQVVRLVDALLANADSLLTSAIAVLDLGHVALARSLAILGLEESGKAIAVHERRVQMGYIADGEPFRCEALDEVWSSHQKKLEAVHGFLVDEFYWFGAGPTDSDEIAARLGVITAWARRHDRSKQRGFYVDLAKSGDVIGPADDEGETNLRDVVTHVHQIGWQLRLGEHIEGKRQDERELGMPPAGEELIVWVDGIRVNDGPAAGFPDDVRQSMEQGRPGTPLPNSAYRFNVPGADRTPFRNLDQPGYEAETRELRWLAADLGAGDEGGTDLPP